MNFVLSAGTKNQKNDTTYLHLQKMAKSSKPNYKNLHVTLPVIKAVSPPVSSSPKTFAMAEDKLLSNVQVFPNPITDQINVKYTISRNTNVSIKIMDVLGNEIATLLTARVDPGDQKFTYPLRNKLNTGFYFVRIIAGSESQIRRISIL